MLIREELLELTRRMTRARNCFSRIAGCYYDEEGYIEGTFNTNFRKLTPAETEEKLSVAKTIPFAKTNEELVEYPFGSGNKRQQEMKRLLSGLCSCELKNDAMLELFYELAGEEVSCLQNKGIFWYHGTYDIPRKGTDGGFQYESEEIYRFMILAICRVDSDYKPGPPEFGFLYPGFSGRSSVPDRIDIYHGQAHPEYMELFGIKEPV